MDETYFNYIREWSDTNGILVKVEFNFQTNYYTFNFYRKEKTKNGENGIRKWTYVIPKPYLDNSVSPRMSIVSMLAEAEQKFKEAI